MADMADFFNEIHELECDHYDEYRFADSATQYEEGIIDENGAVRGNPGGGPWSTYTGRGRRGFVPEFIPDSGYYHHEIPEHWELKGESETFYFFRDTWGHDLNVPKKIVKPGAGGKFGTAHWPTVAEIIRAERARQTGDGIDHLFDDAEN